MPPFSPATHEIRPERRRPKLSLLDRWAHTITGELVTAFLSRQWRYRGIIRRVGALEKAVVGLDDMGIRDEARTVGLELRRHGFREDLVARSFALIREVAKRTVGKRHHDSQLVGGRVLLGGMVAEMETGEGKTLTATLAAGTAALAGVPVHVITVNDYLAERDAEEMGPVYKALGLTVGCGIHGQSQEDRRKAYLQDITYCTNKEVVFDYLRDGLTLGDRTDPVALQTEYLFSTHDRGKKLLLRGLHFAIVDEADSILIDESRTPLIISKSVGGEDERKFMTEVLDTARRLERGVDYHYEEDDRRIWLTSKGKERLERLAETMGPLWTGEIRRQEMVTQALVSLLIFKKDIHYLVRDGKIQIVDEFTGRVMADRSWERGLHQLIELKEGCDVTQQRVPMARISYQRFFRRYLHLSGMTGTAKEVVRELWDVYDLPVVRIPTHRPVIRKYHPDRLHLDARQRWDDLLVRIRALNAEGRPVLVGTSSVHASELVSGILREASLEHRVLNAKRDKEEAEIVAHAGEKGKITIATNMAGRGTDIKLGPGVADLGGLHVILTEKHEAARIDRQLAGRCGRQGDPGGFECLLSFEDALLAEGRAGPLSRIAYWMMRLNLPGARALGKFAMDRAQKQVEAYHAQVRHELFRQDENWGDLMSFSGRME